MLRNIVDSENKFKTEDICEIYTQCGRVKIIGEKTNDVLLAENDDCIIKSVSLKDESGVSIRRDSFACKSENGSSIKCFLSKFLLNGGEYQVYTQCNTWQNESDGMWQPLNTVIGAGCRSIRTSSGAAPFIVLWNEQTKKGMAFHLIPEFMWKMEARYVYISATNMMVEVSLGIDNTDLNLKLKKGETFSLPDIFYYTFDNKTDMDAYKLHRFLNKHYPRRKMPLLYNSWLCNFDDITYDGLMAQARKAAELGVEYFVIDAGWFGDYVKAWFDAIGDWQEKKTGKLNGRLKELSKEIEALGLMLGIWFEPERAIATADCVANHREFYIEAGENFYIDFGNEQALSFVLESVSKTIGECNVKFVKFDANAELFDDKYHDSFITYKKGYAEFIKRLKTRFPDLYIEGCAGGGSKLDLSQLTLADSIWITDNQSPFDSLKIYKNTILRMQPQMAEKVVTITSVVDVIKPYMGDSDMILACNNATWDEVKSINPSFLKGFMVGTPVLISCDLTAFSDKTFIEIKDYITKFKNEREFWLRAECRILTDTETMLVLQYNDEELNKVVIVVYGLRTRQDRISVYPVLPQNTEYRYNSSVYKNGDYIDVPISKQYTAEILELEKLSEKGVVL